MGSSVGLALGLSVAVYYDLRYRKIPNFVIVSLLCFGLGYNIWHRGVEGLVASVLGILVGLALLIIPFALRGMGAGDVKLLSAVGAVGGVPFVIGVFLYGAIVGGIVSLGVLLFYGKLWPFLRWLLLNIKNLFAHLAPVALSKETASGKGIPYAVAIASGVWLVWILGLPF